MKKLICILLLPLCVNASSVPEYFTPVSNKEYIATINHFEDILLKGGEPAALLGLASPYGLLDIHPTRFTKNKDRNAFSNFNLGVMGSAILGAKEKFTTLLPNLFLCHQAKCREKRLKAIKSFLPEMKKIKQKIEENPNVIILKQMNEQVYRINNVFITPAGVIEYYPSVVAGFIPSNNKNKFDDLSGLVITERLSKITKSTRNIMIKHQITAVVRENDNALNFIFSGISNNHWGLMVITEGSAQKPVVGERNSLGFKFDDVVELSSTTFYYQTN